MSDDMLWKFAPPVVASFAAAGAAAAGAAAAGAATTGDGTAAGDGDGAGGGVLAMDAFVVVGVVATALVQVVTLFTVCKLKGVGGEGGAGRRSFLSRMTGGGGSGSVYEEVNNAAL